MLFHRTIFNGVISGITMDDISDTAKIAFGGLPVIH
jgi:hypothetical protein